MKTCALCRGLGDDLVCVCAQPHFWHRSCVERVVTGDVYMDCALCKLGPKWPTDTNVLRRLVHAVDLLGSKTLNLKGRPIEAAHLFAMLRSAARDHATFLDILDLDLSSCRLTDAAFVWVQDEACTLQHVNFAYNALRQWPSLSGACANVLTMDLSHNLLDGDCVFTGRPQGDKILSPQGQPQVVLPPRLTRLVLSRNPMARLAIYEAPALTVLEVDYCARLQGLVVCGCRRLRALVANYGRLTAKHVEIDDVSRAALQDLRLRGNAGFWGSFGDSHGQLIRDVMSGAAALTRVDLSDTSLNVYHLFSRLGVDGMPAALQGLSLRGATVPYTLECSFLTDVFAAVRFMDLSHSDVRQFPIVPAHLQELRLDSCHALCFSTERDVLRRCITTTRATLLIPAALHTVEMNFCERVTWLPECLMQVTELHAEECSWLGVQALQAFNQTYSPSHLTTDAMQQALPHCEKCGRTCTKKKHVVPVARATMTVLAGTRVPVVKGVLWCRDCRYAVYTSRDATRITDDYFSDAGVIV